LFEENLLQKSQHNDFMIDMHNLIASETAWDFHEALRVVQQNIISKLP